MDITYLYKSNIIRADAPNPVMARKKNSRYVVSSEPEGDVTLKSSTIKSLSGNDPQQVRSLYGNPFNYIPKFKLVIQTNTEPVFHGFDGGMKRRPRVKRFPNKFVENPKLPHERKIDKTLKKKLITDKQYREEFLEIFIDHFNLYNEEGTDLPKRFEEDTKLFIKNNDPIGEWMDSNIEKTNNQRDLVKSSILFDNFVEYMEKDTRGVSTLSFKNTLVSLGIAQKKRNTGNYYIGIKFKGYEEDEDNEGNDDVRDDQV
jgi:phage/plasmid-associated DNA primase